MLLCSVRGECHVILIIIILCKSWCTYVMFTPLARMPMFTVFLLIVQHATFIHFIVYIRNIDLKLSEFYLHSRPGKTTNGVC